MATKNDIIKDMSIATFVREEDKRAASVTILRNIFEVMFFYMEEEEGERKKKRRWRVERERGKKKIKTACAPSFLERFPDASVRRAGPLFLSLSGRPVWCGRVCAG